MNTNEIVTSSSNSKDEENIRKAIADNDLIFTGSVIELGKTPDYWSGYFPAYQGVRYQVEAVLKGHLSAKQITIDHVVVQYSRTAEAGQTPQLSSKFFAKDARILVFAMKATDGTWKNLHQQWGVHPFTDAISDSIRQWIASDSRSAASKSEATSWKFSFYYFLVKSTEE